MNIVKFTIFSMLLILSGACHKGKKKNQEQDRRLDSVEKRLLTLEQRALEIQKLMDKTADLQYQLDQVEGEIDYLREISDDLQDQTSALSVIDEDLDARLTTIENSVILLQTSIENGIDELIDPCGPSTSDEILLKLNNGKIVAYFESGSNRYLSTLKPGSYRTTDPSRCFFTVDANNNVINQHY